MLAKQGGSHIDSHALWSFVSLAGCRLTEAVSEKLAELIEARKGTLTSINLASTSAHSLCCCGNLTLLTLRITLTVSHTPAGNEFTLETPILTDAIKTCSNLTSLQLTGEHAHTPSTGHKPRGSQPDCALVGCSNRKPNSGPRHHQRMPHSSWPQTP